MAAITKTVGRFVVSVSREGTMSHDYGYGGSVEYRTGWNDSCPVERINLSVEEMRDLHYALSRAIDVATTPRPGERT